MKLNKTILASVSTLILSASFASNPFKWEAYVFRGGREALSVAQAAVLGQTFGILSGNPNDLLLAESFHGTIIAWTRQAGMFQAKSSLLVDGDVATAWRSWSQAEEAIRVLLVLHIHDSEFAAIFHHEPLLRHNPIRLPKCCSDELFAAPSAERWHELAKGYNQQDTCSSQALMHSYATLAGHVAGICESRSGHLDSAAVDEIRAALTSWHATHASRIQHPSRDTSCLMILWHEAFMYLYVDFDLLERVLGREGAASQEDMEHLRHWVSTLEGQRCAVHAMLIHKRLDALPINTELALHVPKALFYAGLVIYCHVRFRPAYEDVDITELRGANARFTSPALLLSPSALLSQLDTSALHSVADVLRRQGHWEVSRRFAWILDTLIETLVGAAVVDA